jgi:hypothetical protein
MVPNATFNNNLVISQRSILLVEETRVPEENHRPYTFGIFSPLYRLSFLDLCLLIALGIFELVLHVIIDITSFYNNNTNDIFVFYEYPKRTTDLSQVSDKRYHIMFYRVHLAMNGVGTHNFGGDRH